METRLDTKIGPSSSAVSVAEDEPNFLLVRDKTEDWPRWKRAAIGSVVFHLIAITALFLIKSGPYEAPPPESTRVPYVVHLYVPKELTQKAPNKAPVAKLLLSPAVTPSPKLPEPAPAPKAAQAAAPQPPAPKPQPVAPVPAPVAQQPPTPNPADTAHNQPPASTPPPVAVAKPDAPKMIVEDSIQAHPSAPKPSGLLAPATNSIQDAMNKMSSGGPPSSHTHVGDSDEIGVGSGLHLPASAPKPQSSLEIKSDPMGVDFKPYLLQVLQAVRTNWFAVYPEAARLGSRGRVVLEFSVTKTGGVLKVVFAGQSGSRPLDQAAVAAISASNPLPPLPKDFKGDSIVLQMSFMYNMPR